MTKLSERLLSVEPKRLQGLKHHHHHHHWAGSLYAADSESGGGGSSTSGSSSESVSESTSLKSLPLYYNSSPTQTKSKRSKADAENYSEVNVEVLTTWKEVLCLAAFGSAIIIAIICLGLKLV
jgi:hypothetical protein